MNNLAQNSHVTWLTQSQLRSADSIAYRHFYPFINYHRFFAARCKLHFVVYEE